MDIHEQNISDTEDEELKANPQIVLPDGTNGNGSIRIGGWLILIGINVVLLPISLLKVILDLLFLSIISSANSICREKIFLLHSFCGNIIIIIFA